MTKDYCIKQKKEITDYLPILEFVEKVNRLVDIINEARVKNNKNLKVRYMDSPYNKHVYELLSNLQFFEECREDAGGLTDKCITQESYEDLS